MVYSAGLASKRRTANSAYRILTGVLLVLVFVQAVLAGRFLYGSSATITLHGVIGNGAFVVALVLLGIAVVARFARRTIVIASVLALLMTAQIGLGYATANASDLGAWHIPLGVAIFGLSVFNLGAPSRATHDDCVEVDEPVAVP